MFKAIGQWLLANGYFEPANFLHINQRNTHAFPHLHIVNEMRKTYAGLDSLYEWFLYCALS
ncbi:MAG: hypothetical protein ABJA35_17060 [Parafilimonas sp.]